MAQLENKNYSPGAIANYFLEKSWDKQAVITPMKLQKLMYFANGWYMAFQDGDRIIPLINEPFQAWEYGPVCSSVYHEFKGFGNNPITKNHLMTEVIVSDDLLNFEIKTKKIPQNDEEAKILLDKVWGRYFDLSAFQLSKMTHCDDDDNPWKVAIESAEKEYIVRGKEINSEDIRKYFKKLLKAKRAY